MKLLINFILINPNSKKNLHHLFVLFISLFYLITLPEICYAGTGGSGFQGLVETIEGYMTGAPAIAVLLTGLAYSIYFLMIKHTVIPLALVVLAGAVCGSGSAIIRSLVSALV